MPLISLTLAPLRYTTAAACQSALELSHKAQIARKVRTGTHGKKLAR
jgi:hypothetical protein